MTRIHIGFWKRTSQDVQVDDRRGWSIRVVRRAFVEQVECCLSGVHDEDGLAEDLIGDNAAA